MAEKKQDKIKESKFTKRLKVGLTTPELLQAGEDLAKTLDEICDIEDEKKAIVENFKAKLTELEAQATQFQQKVRNKWEYQPVDCIETMNNTNGTVTKKRLDTNEVIEERKMTYDERQSKLWDEEYHQETA